MANIKDVASYLVSLSQPSSPRANTPSKLQKLVYFAQGTIIDISIKRRYIVKENDYGQVNKAI